MKKMQVIGKSRLSVQNEVVVKQKRISHEVTMFDVPIEKFREIIETIPFGSVVSFQSLTSIDITYSYSYQSNLFTYFLSPAECISFMEYAEQNNVKILKNEI